MYIIFNYYLIELKNIINSNDFSLNNTRFFIIFSSTYTQTQTILICIHEYTGSYMKAL